MAKRSSLTSAAQDVEGTAQANSSLIERVYLLMRSDIIEGRLGPGEKLRVEHLKSRYGVSAGTLREAITRLVSDALVVAESQRGFRVTSINADDLEQLTQLRLLIEIDALRCSIRRSDKEWRARLSEAYAALAAISLPVAPDERGAWELLNSRFHEALISGCASAWTLNVLRLLSRHGERYRRYTLSLPNSGRDLQAEHREIFEQALAGKEARAALALEAHVRNTLDLIRAAQREGVDVFGEAAAKGP